MVVLCDIEFDKNPDCTFFSRQVINGSVSLEVDKPKEVKAVILRILGSARTYWTEDNNSYWGHEDYINSETCLVRSENAKKHTLQAGKHHYTFTFELPKKCPSSFEGKNGFIRYTLKVVLIRPWKFNQTFTKPLSVINELDLNSEGLKIERPLLAKAEKRFLCGLFDTESLVLEVKLAKSGFVPGENIPMELVITNDSGVVVKQIRVSLVMIAQCFENVSKVSSISEWRDVSKLKNDGMLSHCKKFFKYELPVKATPPTCVDVCSVIKITYEVRVEVKFNGLHISQMLCLPVIIGTVPFKTDTLGKDEMTSKLSSDNQASASAVAHIAPPIYEEAIHIPHVKINADEEHDYGQRDFAPRYPVFFLKENCTAASKESSE